MGQSFYSNSRELLESLQWKITAFQKSSLDVDLAFDCAVRAWSLCDWVHAEFGSRLGYPSLGTLQGDARRECPQLEYLQDLATASKHKIIKGYVSKTHKADLHRGAFDARAFSRGFDVSRLRLLLRDGAQIDLEDALVAVERFWVGFFTKHKLI
jgi:hypothetical protein